MNEDCRIEEFEEKPIVSKITYGLYWYLCDPQKTADRTVEQCCTGRKA